MRDHEWLGDVREATGALEVRAWVYGQLSDMGRARHGMLVLADRTLVFYRRRFVGQELRGHPLRHVAHAVLTDAPAGQAPGQLLSISFGDGSWWQMTRIAAGQPELLVELLAEAVAAPRSG